MDTCRCGKAPPEVPDHEMPYEFCTTKCQDDARRARRRIVKKICAEVARDPEKFCSDRYDFMTVEKLLEDLGS